MLRRPTPRSHGLYLVAFALVTNAALLASADLAKALGPYPEFAGEREARVAPLKAKPFAAALKAAKAHGLRHSAATHLEGRGVASDATFDTSREHALPAAQRATLQCPRPADWEARLR